MTRDDVLRWKERHLYPGSNVDGLRVLDIILCYESLLSRCVPHLQWLVDDGGLDEEDDAMVRALLAELKEVKHG